MYRKGRSLPLKESSLALPNNLAVLPLPQGKRGATYYASVHGPTVNMVSTPGDEEGDGGPLAATCAHRQLQVKEGGHGLGLGATLITQAAWCILPSRILLVLTSRKGIQMYEPDGSVMVYWHALEGMETSSPGKAAFARGIAATGQRFVCVGTSSGAVLIFDVPAKGTNVTLSEVLEKHASSITDIGAELCEQLEGAPDLVTADDSGGLCVWCSGEKFKLLTQISASDCSCSSVKLWNGVIAAGYGNGQIRLFQAATGALRAEVSAHARWIYALDLAPLSGKLLSAGEDSYVQVWRVSHNPDTETIEIEHCHGECVTDTLLCGARFCNPEGSAFAVTGFELNEIIRYIQV
ncbi:WD repeat-containing protein 54 [Sceloporus undulatus]|uniref:WD repeat-containing protein 54 n=1 Tax=Sceloporus undulatus TaxID=8520 RepID=UPI001C4BEF28|nr:WD repeat-containing protein 54 [Sceloporus undulatus]XP_042322922.1 WD repeat-containing protein 54 [Sceloporus undulatus]XP_042322924.1 WD repeat-containing protein 54 [Sceloporus undulatus]